jgi:hypothetical protein
VRILIACEYSGTVRDAFRNLGKGHEVLSCDLLPTESPGPHYQGDIRDIIGDGWDLMICHPPCTYLSVSGLHWNSRVSGRAEKTEEALEFVRLLLEAPIPRICLENPVSCISSRIRKPDQIIQPYEFGHPESKKTCLWLKNLPRLIPTDVLSLPSCGYWENQTPNGQNKLGPSPDRWKIRSKTYTNIAQAMAEQWG